MLVDDSDRNSKYLNDQNRSVRVAEKMCERYDNQWTDSFDELEKSIEEKEIIRKLLQIVTVRI